MVAHSTMLLFGTFSLVLPAMINAHVALWSESMYGLCDGGNGINNKCIDTSYPCVPLQQQDFGPGRGGVGWWFHGAMDQPPAADKFFDFPAGGKITAEVNCNKAGTSVQLGDAAKDVKYVCGSNVNVHTADTFDKPPTDHTKGCAIAMAWKSDPATIVPSDLIVVSTNRSCPFYAKVDFSFPADLPACPAGGCHAFWLWIHEAGDYGGYSKQMYMTPFKARVIGATSTTLYPTPRLARKCKGAPKICVKGAKNPHYWMQNEKNNAANPDFDPPYYNVDYNWANGAQTDLRYQADPVAEMAWKKDWSYVGCYYDDNRMLGAPYIESWQNEPEFCMAQCDAAGFKYAAVEYGYQCMCGNTIRGNKITENNCNVPCAANPATMCGGGGTMNIFTRGAAAFAAPVSSSAKPASSSVNPASSSVKPASSSVKLASSSAAIRRTTAVATSSARVVARGIDEAGDEFEEEQLFEAPPDRTVFVRETVTETAFHFITLTEKVQAPAETHVDRNEIPFLHKPHGNLNLNHHVGVHI